MGALCYGNGTMAQSPRVAVVTPAKAVVEVLQVAATGAALVDRVVTDAVYVADTAVDVAQLALGRVVDCALEDALAAVYEVTAHAPAPA
jgi:hypothetical protein